MNYEYLQKTCENCGEPLTIEEVMDKEISDSAWVCHECDYQEEILVEDFIFDEKI